jgi:outer membrane protein OmpA-like peptidoglycan-associated protein
VGILLLTMGLYACVTAPSKDDSADTAPVEKKAVRLSQTPRGAMISSDERILFDSGKSDIKPDGEIFLDRVATILKDKTTANVLVEGHTDNVGSAQSNLLLSQARAAAVKRGFLARGLKDTRIQTQGYGQTKPVADNATPDGRQANRRTEIIVLGESMDKLGGASLADRLSEGLDRFLKKAGSIFDKVKDSVVNF